ncbi:MAG: hypothetical protein RL368_1023 [Pseudomonadota bacterium]
MRIIVSLLLCLCAFPAAYAQEVVNSSDILLEQPYRVMPPRREQRSDEQRARREHMREEQRARREHFRDNRRERRREHIREERR